MFLKISQNSQENTWKETPAQVFSCEFCYILNNTFSYRTPPVFTSETNEMDWVTESNYFSREDYNGKKTAKKQNFQIKTAEWKSYIAK